jgi:hypothetical protein
MGNPVFDRLIKAISEETDIPCELTMPASKLVLFAFAMHC